MPATKPASPILQPGDPQAADLAWFGVAYEGAGTTLHDLSVTGNDGTLGSDTAWGTGQFFGPDLNIANNPTRSAKCATTAGFQLAGAITVSLWVKLTDPTANQGLACCYTAEGGNNGWILGVDDVQTGKAKWFTVHPGGDDVIYSDTVLSAGVWYHILATYTPGSPGEKNLFIDGVLEASSTPSGAIRYSNGGGGPYAVIGAVNITSDQPLLPAKGEIDAVAIYSADLSGSPSLIASLFADPFTAVRDTTLALGTVSQVGTSGLSTIALQVGPASAGTAPYTYQWQRSPYGTATWANVGTNSTTLNDTGLDPSTSYDYRVTVTDSAGTPASVTSATISAATLWPVDHAFVSQSPACWSTSGSGPAAYTQAVNAGARFRFGFTGTSASLILDLAPLTAGSVPLSGVMAHSWSIDGGVGVYTATTAAVMALASGLAAGPHAAVYEFLGASSAYDRWTPYAVSRIVGIQLDPGASLAAPPTVPTDKLIVFGDSITEGAYAGPTGNGDSRYSYVSSLASGLNSEASYSAFSGTGYVASLSGVPAFASAFPNYSSGKPRVLTGFKRAILNHGRNDSSGIAATIATDLTALRAALGPDTLLYVVIPFAGTIASDLTSAFATYGGTVTTGSLPGGITYRTCSTDSKAYLINLGAAGSQGLNSGASYYSVDGTHPNTLGQSRLASLLVDTIGAIEAAVSVHDTQTTGIAPALNGLATVYCTDENIALRAWGDYMAVCPPSQKLAAGTDGVILSADRWTLTSATVDFEAAGIVPGHVVWLKLANTFGSNGEIYAVNAVDGDSVTLRRLGQTASVGQPPAPAAGLTGVSFSVLTFGPQIDVASYDANHFFGIDVISPTKSPARMYDQRELQSYVVLMVLKRAYAISLKQKAEDYALKLEQVSEELSDLTARLTIRWGSDGKSEPPTSIFSTRVRR